MRILIAAGGTGGHIYPGLAVAQAFLKKDKRTEIKFVGTEGGIENKIIPREGFILETIAVQGIKGKSFFEILAALLKLPGAFIKTLKIIINYQPQLVVGLGSFASGPVVFAAWLLKVPVIIQEQNLFPGITNRIAGRMVKKVAISFPESEKYFPRGKTCLTGNPIRKEFFQELKKETKNNPFLRNNFCLLIFGGSQGSQRINETMLEAINFLEEFKDLLYLIHQTGEKDFSQVKNAYARKGFLAKVSPFLFEMAQEYKQANLVICRAGAGTLSELTCCGKPAILIPYPYAANNHQEINAFSLKEKGAVEVIREKDLSGKLLAERITFFIHNRAYLKKMSERSKLSGNPLAAEKVVSLGYGLI